MQRTGPDRRRQSRTRHNHDSQQRQPPSRRDPRWLAKPGSLARRRDDATDCPPDTPALFSPAQPPGSTATPGTSSYRDTDPRAGEEERGTGRARTPPRSMGHAVAITPIKQLDRPARHHLDRVPHAIRHPPFFLLFTTSFT
jgi:hypothetical protein